MQDETWEVKALRHLTDLMNRVSAQDDLGSLFETVVEGAADVVGFTVAAISLVDDATGDLVVVAVAGDDSAKTQLMGRHTPRAAIDREFAVAERWGSLRFVPADRLPAESQDGWVATDWSRDTDDPDAWDPEDTLLAPLLDAVGDLLGHLSVDLPLSGRRPDPTQRAVLELFANQTAIAIQAARQRHALTERVRLGEAVKSVARIAQDDLEPAQVVDVAAPRIAAGLASDTLWLRIFGVQGEDERESVSARSGETVVAPSLIDLAHRLSARLWAEGEVAVARPGRCEPAREWSPADVALASEFLAAASAGSLLLAPIGSGSACYGYLAAVRNAGDALWTDAETQAALEMARDLGRAVRNARLYAAERRVAEELREADRSRTQLFSTVSHELKNPLASIVGHVELLRGEPENLAWSLGVIGRNTERLQLLVDDLLTLSRVSDPDRDMQFTEVDLGELARDVVDMFRPRADGQEVGLTFDKPLGVPAVLGSADDLERVVQNLVSNAVKFTPAGGAVSVSLERRTEGLALTCVDDGIGISMDDQERLFTEFFRGTNPEGLKVPGTGLGLSIAHRVVERHGGRLEVESELGRGTSVTLLLPVS